MRNKNKDWSVTGKKKNLPCSVGIFTCSSPGTILGFWQTHGYIIKKSFNDSPPIVFFVFLTTI